LKHLPFDFAPIVSAQVAKVHYNLAGRSQVCIPTAGMSLTWANFGAWLFYSLPEICFYVGAANPHSTDGFVATLNDQRGYDWLVPYILGCAAESLVTFKWIKPIVSQPRRPVQGG